MSNILQMLYKYAYSSSSQSHPGWVLVGDIRGKFLGSKSCSDLIPSDRAHLLQRLATFCRGLRQGFLSCTARTSNRPGALYPHLQVLTWFRRASILTAWSYHESRLCSITSAHRHDPQSLTHSFVTDSFPSRPSCYSSETLHFNCRHFAEITAGRCITFNYIQLYWLYCGFTNNSFCVYGNLIFSK